MTATGRADARFLLARPAQRVAVLDADGWRRELEELGLDIVGQPLAGAGPAAAPDLAVAPAERWRDALATGAPAVILEGPGRARQLRRAGLAAERLLPLPQLRDPELILPLGQRAPAAYAAERLASPASRRERLRNRVAAPLLAAGAAPPRRPLVTVAQREPGPPFLVAAARDRGIVPEAAGWMLAPGRGDLLTRGLFYLFARGRRDPAWALKFTRVPGYRETFDRDERGFRVLEAAGPATARHAPKLCGRMEVAGLQASVETAAIGRRLIALLASPAPRAEKQRVIDAIAAWLVEVGIETRGAPGTLAPELAPLAREVLPHWPDAGISPRLVEELPPMPALLNHGDLGSWNIVVGPDRDFTAIDWEDAVAQGPPLWDLWYFLADALAHLDGATAHEEQERHFVRLFRGELPSSGVLFEWTRRAAGALGIPADALGPLATLCFLRHGVSHLERGTTLGLHAPEGAAAATVHRRLAERWLSEPGLGPGWGTAPLANFAGGVG